VSVVVASMFIIMSRVIRSLRARFCRPCMGHHAIVVVVVVFCSLYIVAGCVYDVMKQWCHIVEISRALSKCKLTTHPTAFS